MKLPDDPKDKMKVLLLITIGVLATVAAVAQGVIYLIRQENQLSERLADLEWQTTSANENISSAENCRTKNVHTIQSIVTISETHILHPILGNYRLGASEVLERIALGSGISLDSIQEVGILDIPKPKNKTGKNVLKAYTVRISTHCGYAKLQEFIRQLELNNPYVCISTLSIIGQQDVDPESHRVVMGIQWPIWSNPEMAVQMMERMTQAYKGKEKDHADQ
ncbi:MAG: hypothetical protein ISS35_02750 [Kiritimatiellae bacterium]|nr:hypothetical protein [Kiritimatiellia bacterium]